MLNANAIIAAFSPLGSVSIEEQDGDHYMNIMVEGEGVEDWFYLEAENGRIIWTDFSHQTDLGPVDGSEVISRLEAFEAARKGN